jgi:hypothetical protein
MLGRSPVPITSRQQVQKQTTHLSLAPLFFESLISSLVAARSISLHFVREQLRSTNENVSE